MNEINKYKLILQNFIESYSKELPSNVTSVNNSKASWSDPVWYIRDPNTNTLHRYLFTKVIKGKKRLSRDSQFKSIEEHKIQLMDEPYSTLLKIYALEVQTHSIVSSSKQYRVTVASKVLTNVHNYKSLHDIPLQFWCETKMSNLFWDFCNHNDFLSGNRPVHIDRSRSAEDQIEKNNNILKMIPESLIFACGEIFQKVFKNVDENGELNKGGCIDVQDAKIITGILLGLASPDRLNGELPLLCNQKLKIIQPKLGSVIHYLDWPGSKGFHDNQNHVLSALAPQVKKAINFFHYHFKPERYFVRFLKNSNQSWSQLLEGFELDPERQKHLNFNVYPNLFTVAYALGFYPIEYKITLLKDVKYINKTSSIKGWKYNSCWDPQLKRKLNKTDAHETIHVSKIQHSHLLLNLTYNGSNNGVCQLLNTSSNLNHNKNKELNLTRITTVKLLEEAVLRIQNNLIPTFPIGYAGTDIGIDMESILFCWSPGKHNVPDKKGLAGSPLIIAPITTIKSDLTSAINGNEKFPKTNIFFKYGFGFHRLKLHSLRHFSNTHAEKGEIPLTVIAAWSGRSSVKQTLEYVHTSESEKTDRLIKTLDLDSSTKDIKVISKNELKQHGGLPASITETGICIQELSVTPCNYMNNFLSRCFACENSCYVCGDRRAIEMFEHDLVFQKKRLKKLQENKQLFTSQATRDWWVNHSQAASLLKQLIGILKQYPIGDLVRIDNNKQNFFITNKNTKNVEQKFISLPSKNEILKQIENNSMVKESIPAGMKSLLLSFGTED